MPRNFINILGRDLATAGIDKRDERDLTMSIYTDPIMLDVGAAVNALTDFKADRHAALAACEACPPSKCCT